MQILVLGSNLGSPGITRLRGLLRNRMDSQATDFAEFSELEKHLASLPADIVLVVLSGDSEEGMAALRRARQATAAPVLAVGGAQNSHLILRALSEGADHYIDEATLEHSLESALERYSSRCDQGTPPGRLVAVLGAAGGTGASTISVNLSTLLAREHKRCALLDLKTGRGDLAALLDLRPSFHLADLCVNISRLDQAMLEKAMVRHASGVHLLASPQVFGDSRLVKAPGVNQILTLARRVFPYVVVDLEDCFHEEQVMALHQASALILLSRLDFTSLRSVRRILDHLEHRGISRQIVRLVVNRHGQPNELPITEVEQVLGGKLTHCIPDDPKTINAANNTGIPAVLKAPTSRVAQAIANLMKIIREPERTEMITTMGL